MLVLTRNLNDPDPLKHSLTIDGPATITVLRSRGGTVRLGIEAPKTTRVLRSELVDHQANDQADAA